MSFHKVCSHSGTISLLLKLHYGIQNGWPGIFVHVCLANQIWLGRIGESTWNRKVRNKSYKLLEPNLNALPSLYWSHCGCFPCALCTYNLCQWDGPISVLLSHTNCISHIFLYVLRWFPQRQSLSVGAISNISSQSSRKDLYLSWNLNMWSIGVKGD